MGWLTTVILYLLISQSKFSVWLPSTLLNFFNLSFWWSSSFHYNCWHYHSFIDQACLFVNVLFSSMFCHYHICKIWYLFLLNDKEKNKKELMCYQFFVHDYTTILQFELKKKEGETKRLEKKEELPQNVSVGMTVNDWRNLLNQEL